MQLTARFGFFDLHSHVQIFGSGGLAIVVHTVIVIEQAAQQFDTDKTETGARHLLLRRRLTTADAAVWDAD
jgi:hypothetical protein